MLQRGPAIAFASSKGVSTMRQTPLFLLASHDWLLLCVYGVDWSVVCFPKEWAALGDRKRGVLGCHVGNTLRIVTMPRQDEIVWIRSGEVTMISSPLGKVDGRTKSDV